MSGGPAEKSGGFTMVELMIAVAVFSTAILGTLAAMGVASQMAAASREEAVARQAAQRRMADLLALGYAGLTVGSSTFTLDAHEQRLLLPPTTTGSSPGEQTVAAAGNLRDVTVTVNWHSTVLRRDLSVTLGAKVAP